MQQKLSLQISNSENKHFTSLKKSFISTVIKNYLGNARFELFWLLLWHSKQVRYLNNGFKLQNR